MDILKQSPPMAQGKNPAPGGIFSLPFLGISLQYALITGMFPVVGDLKPG
ncbi:MAG: hypothetical protein LBQ49_03130 [Rickettsiales bacterium]|jgi:hypothetical protein|nr:hypothetical protein [Rickettsiales bacterium]